MKRKMQVVKVLAGLTLWFVATVPTKGADSITNFGIVHLALGQATITDYGSMGGIINVTTNEGDGVSLFLGESDSGLFVTPFVSYPEPQDFLHAEAYGQLNGVTNQLLAIVRGHQEYWNSYYATVDFSPLGASSLSVVAFDGEEVVGVVTNAGSEFGVGGNDWGNPLRRAAPFWRMADGSVGALFEFSWRTTFGPFEVPIGNRYFVRCENPTNTAGFMARLDILSQDLPRPDEPEPTNFGTGLVSFELGNLRLGMFHRAHMGLNGARLEATNGRLNVLQNTNQYPELESSDGVAAELGRATVFRANLLPLDLSAEGASFRILGIGNAAGVEGSVLGTMRVENTNDAIRVSAEFGIAPRFAQIVVLSGGVPVGTNGVPRDMVWVTLNEFPRVIGAGLLARTLATLPGFTVRFDEVTTFSTSSGQTFDGDEVRLLASDPAQFESLETCVMGVAGLTSFTITGESSEAFIRPSLTMRRSDNDLLFSWPDPNEIFELDRASLVDLPDEEILARFFQAVTNAPITSLEGHRSVRLPINFSRNHIFQLRHGEPRPPPNVD